MKKSAILSAVLVGIFSFVLVASAEIPYVPLAPLPIGAGGATPTSYTMSTYLSGMLKLLIALGGATAILMAIIGGTQYVASGIAPSAKQDAKNRITSAFIGLALVLTSYLILNSINPKLVAVNFMLPAIGAPTGAGIVVTGVVAPGVCSITPLDVLSGTALEMENMSPPRVLFTSDSTGVQQNLSALKKEIDNLSTALGVTVQVNSAYRPYAYQKHLYDIVNKWVNQGLKDNTDTACRDIKVAIGREYTTHNLGTVVSLPSNCSVHTKGKAVDLQASPSPATPDSKIGNVRLADINAFMASHNISNLYWQGLSDDPVHFYLKNPPYSGCDTLN